MLLESPFHHLLSQCWSQARDLLGEQDWVAAQPHLTLAAEVEFYY